MSILNTHELMRASQKLPESLPECKQRIQQGKQHIEYLTHMATAAVAGSSEHARVKRAEILTRRIMLDGTLTWMPAVLDAYQHDLDLTRSMYAQLNLASLCFVRSTRATLTQILESESLDADTRAVIARQLDGVTEAIEQTAPNGLDARITELQAELHPAVAV